MHMPRVRSPAGSWVVAGRAWLGTNWLNLVWFPSGFWFFFSILGRKVLWIMTPRGWRPQARASSTASAAWRLVHRNKATCDIFPCGHCAICPEAAICGVATCHNGRREFVQPSAGTSSHSTWRVRERGTYPPVLRLPHWTNQLGVEAKGLSPKARTEGQPMA